jgi:hypothetical protein
MALACDLVRSGFMLQPVALASLIRANSGRR